MPDAEQFHTFHGVTQAMSSPISAAATAASPVPANPRSRVVLASLIGTTIEFYDFYVYATAAVLVFPHLFFPTGNPTAALLASFAVFGAAMVARPIGAVIFGHLGDRHGRKATLVGALLTMGIATFLIGVLPTYAMVGWLAPLLLVSCASRRASRSAASGRARPSWPPRTPRRASAPGTAPSRSSARRSASSSPTACSS